MERLGTPAVCVSELPRFAHTPALLISGNAAGPSLAGPGQIGDALFLAKPFNLDQLLRAIEALAQGPSGESSNSVARAVRWPARGNVYGWSWRSGVQLIRGLAGNVCYAQRGCRLISLPPQRRRRIVVPPAVAVGRLLHMTALYRAYSADRQIRLSIFVSAERLSCVQQQSRANWRIALSCKEVCHVIPKLPEQHQGQDRQRP